MSHRKHSLLLGCASTLFVLVLAIIHMLVIFGAIVAVLASLFLKHRPCAVSLKPRALVGCVGGLRFVQPSTFREEKETQAQAAAVWMRLYKDKSLNVTYGNNRCWCENDTNTYTVWTKCRFRKVIPLGFEWLKCNQHISVLNLLLSENSFVELSDHKCKGLRSITPNNSKVSAIIIIRG